MNAECRHLDQVHEVQPSAWAARMRSIFEVEEDSHAKKAVLRL